MSLKARSLSSGRWSPMCGLSTVYNFKMHVIAMERDTLLAMESYVKSC